MFKLASYTSSLVALLAGALFAAPPVPPSESILPETTQGWASATDFQDLIKHFDQTQYGKLLNDPSMAGFVADFKRDTKNNRAKNPDSLPLSFDDVKEIAGGEVAVGLVDPLDRVPAQVLIVDVVGREAAAQQKLAATFANLVKEGAAASAVKHAGQTITVYQTKDDVRWVHFQLGTLLCVTRDVEIARDILHRALNGPAKSLGTFQPFVKVQQRLELDVSQRQKKDPDANVHQGRWFIQPIGFMAAREAQAAEKDRLPKAQKKKKQTQSEILQKTGFDGIKGVGGTVSFHGKKYDVLHHVAAYAPKPWVKSLNCLSLVNQPQGLDAPDWLTPNLANFTAFYSEGLTAFDNYGPLFDVRVDRDDKNRQGAWQSALRGFKRPPPDGQDVDLRADFVERIVRPNPVDPKAPPISRVYMVSDNKTPITGDSERRLTAIEIYGTNGETPQQGAVKVKEALEKMFRAALNPPPTALRHPNKVPGVIIFEMLPDPAKEEPPKVEVDVDINVAAPPPPSPKLESEAICVANGYLLHASHMSLLVKVLQEAEEAKKAKRQPRLLTNDPDYKHVWELLDQECQARGWGDACLRRFMRTDEEFRHPYELAQVNKLHESNGLLARIIRSSPGFSAKKQGFDGRKLPPYQAAQPYFRPAGAVTRYEADGWFIISLTTHASNVTVAADK